MPTYYTLTCQQCGVQFSRLSKHRFAKFCSNKCVTESQKSRVALICQHCGADFEKPKSYSHRQFCSTTCTANARAVDITQRFNEHFTAGDPLACWEFDQVDPNGYGTIHRRDRSKVGAHRLAVEIKIGRRLNSDEIVCHKCDNPPCVNPDHLFIGTYTDNRLDCVTKGRHNRGEKCHTAVLSERDATAVIQEIKDGKIPTEIARRYGVHPSSIYAIRSNRTWRHLPR